VYFILKTFNLVDKALFNIIKDRYMRKHLYLNDTSPYYIDFKEDEEYYIWLFKSYDETGFGENNIYKTLKIKKSDILKEYYKLPEQIK